MSALFRFFLTLLFGWDRYPSKGMLDDVVSRHRVGLRDIDLNWHMNNARYLNFLDTARLEHAIRTGLFSIFRQRGNFLVANLEISYIRSLLPFQRFEIHTRVLGWDQRYYYIQHEFHAGGELYAKAYARLVFMRQGRRVEPGQIIAPRCDHPESPALPASIRHWQEMLAAKRMESQPADSRKAA